MKKFILFAFVLSVLFVQAQDIAQKDIPTKIKEVTVFINGAQIQREKNVDLTAGTSLIKFTGLSPYIDAKSIQVKASGNLYVLSVNFQKNYLNAKKTGEALAALNEKINALNEKIKLEKTHLTILQAELDFLNDNRQLGGKNEQLTVSNLREAASYYTDKITAIKLKEIERNKTVDELAKELAKLIKQKSTLASDLDSPSGEIWVKVEAKSAAKVPFSLQYLVENAGWFPSYDVRAKSINEPLQIVYKANIHQDTKVDWDNVKINFSSANPSTGGTPPELIPYFLSYNSVPPAYQQKFTSVSGFVTDERNEPLPGVTVVVKGTTIGTTTDLSGNYTLAVPANGGSLNVSFIGMEEQTIPINKPYINVRLKPSNIALNEVVVTGYGTETALQGKAEGIRIRGTSSLKKEPESTLPPPTLQVVKQTSFAFALEKPYSLKSDNKTQTVAMQELEIDASYEYFSIPKIDPDAFLMAYVTNWEKLNLMEGEANLFFEDTYVGKSIIDVRSVGDTLSISLGRDKNVQVKREKQKSLSSKQFIGNKKEESHAWTIEIKNNKQQPIHITVLDQLPVPMLEEIELQTNKLSGAKYNAETGELKWAFKLSPNTTKKLDVQYTLKFPKSRRVIVD